MKFLKELLKKNWAPYTIATCSAVLLFFILSNISYLGTALSAFCSVASPVLLGVVIAYVLNPLVELIRKSVFFKMKHRKLGRNLSVFTAVLLVLSLVVLLLVALVPQVVDSIAYFAENFEGYTVSLQKVTSEFVDSMPQGGQMFAVVEGLWQNLTQSVSKALSNNLGNIIGTSFNIGKSLFNVAIGFILAIYFALDAPRIMDTANDLLHLVTNEKKYKEIVSFMRKCNHILLRFIVCDILEGCIVGVVNFVFMSIFGMDYAVLISVVVGVTNLAPTFGPIVGCVIGAFILVLVNPWYALWFVAFTIVLQTIDGYVIKPKLYGDTLGVSALWILIAIVLGGRIFGVAGILLAIPFAAICDYIVREMFWKKVEDWKVKNKG